MDIPRKIFPGEPKENGGKDIAYGALFRNKHRCLHESNEKHMEPCKMRCNKPCGN